MVVYVPVVMTELIDTLKDYIKDGINEHTNKKD